jgi:putative membrane protein
LLLQGLPVIFRPRLLAALVATACAAPGAHAVDLIATGSLAGTLLVWPLRLILAPLKMVTTLGVLIPVGFLFEWLISILLFGFTAWLIQGFRLRSGLISAALGALAYSVFSFIALRSLGLEVPLLRAMTLFNSGSSLG